MLGQFISAFQGMLTPILLWMSLGVLLRVDTGRKASSSARLLPIGVAVGLAGATVFAALRATAVINQRTAVSFPTLVVCVLLDICVVVVICLSRRVVVDGQSWARAAADGVAALAIAAAFFRAAPEVILQLTNFILPGEPVFTSEMLLRALGFVLGIGLAVVVAAIFRGLSRTSGRLAFTVASLLLAVLVFVQHATSLAQLFQARRVVHFSGSSFRTLVWFINSERGLVIAQAAVFLIPAAVSLVASVSTPLTGENEAVVRTRRATRRDALRWAAWSVLAVAATATTLTRGVAEANKKPVLSPPEDYQLADGSALVSLTAVADGHLHRFQYKAADGTVMRFLVVKKNGGAYGVALDACDNCGDAGYYEKDGKVICKRCDVAINVATIGFKGGCNPIPLDFDIHDGNIRIRTSALDAKSRVF